MIPGQEAWRLDDLAVLAEMMILQEEHTSVSGSFREEQTPDHWWPEQVTQEDTPVLSSTGGAF